MASVQVPMVGSWEVEVLTVRPFTIHSDLYYELHATRDDLPGQALVLRVPEHAVEAEPRAGERMTLTFLMGQVTSAKPI